MTKEQINVRIEEIKVMRAERKVREIELNEQKLTKLTELNLLQNEINNNTFENTPESLELNELLIAQKVLERMG